MAGYAYDRLSVVDNSFLAIESPSAHQHVGAVTLFDAGPLRRADGGIDIDRVRAYVDARLHLIPRYRQRLTVVPLGTRLVWVDDEHFNIHYHVRHTSLPRPGDERQLERLAARIVSQQLDRAKPLWEMWIVEGLADGRFALIAKTHHSMIDGIAGVDLMAVLLSPTDDDAIPPRPTWIPRPAPGRFALFRAEWTRRLSEPLALLSSVPCTLAAPATLVSQAFESVRAVIETLGSTLHPASPTPFNRAIGPHRRIDWMMLDLAAVKAVKDTLGGTVNDVVLATVAGALRRFFERRRINPDLLDIRANVPVSLRTKEERGTLGNRIALWMTELPVAESDPLRRLAAVRATTARLKASKLAMGAEVLAAVSEWTSSTLLALAVQLSTRSRPFNLVVTNVPGPQIPLYLVGAPLRECYPIVNLLANQGLGVALFSYAGRLCWGITADWDLVPDLHDFVGDIEASFAELRHAAERMAAAV
jgi:WS/DGAT/MGAT family acyltransferase